MNNNLKNSDVVISGVVMFNSYFLGAWSDRVGRQFNTMLGSAALGINIMSNVYMCALV